ncbi:MAG: DUF427 domain-containing protein [Actinomycetia bacterium]|nr:DUF427 domain-containing protein [Actinomycetes bacterium]
MVILLPPAGRSRLATHGCGTLRSGPSSSVTRLWPPRRRPPAWVSLCCRAGGLCPLGVSRGPDSIRWDHFSPTERTTGCPWKGTASYYNVNVEGTELSNAAWTYHEPKDAAAEIRDHVAFYGAVTVST